MRRIDPKIFYTLLSDSERLKASSFFREKDQKNSIITHGLLRLILSHYCHLSPAEILIHRSHLGKPYMSDTKLHFNLSHAKDLLVIAIADHNIGVDVEYITEDFEWQQVVKLVLSKEEQRVLVQSPRNTQQAKFFEYWTAKEAVLKLMGTGFRHDPTTLQIIDGQVSLLSSTDRKARIVLTPLTLIKHHFTGYVAYTKRASQMLITYHGMLDLDVL